MTSYHEFVLVASIDKTRLKKKHQKLTKTTMSLEEKA